MEEKRRFTRVKAEVCADVFASGFLGKGLRVKDLSLKGAFIVSERKPSLGADVKLVIRTVGEGDSAEVKGTVVRKEESGFAVEFKEVELSSFIKLKTIIASNLTSSEELEKNIKRLI